MASFSSSKVTILMLGFLIGTLPGIFIGFSSKYSYSIVTTVQHQEDCKKEIEESGINPIPAVGDGGSSSSNNNPPLVHPNWCPKANCTNTDLCHPCQRRFLIVIATARSASTTLTWMLNELPGVRMSGENNNHLDMVWQMQTNLWNHTSFTHGSERKSAWGHNYIPRQNFACAAQSTVEAINPPQLMSDQTTIQDPMSAKHDIIGFKTIRFDRGAERNPTEMVDMVKENFPCSRILININSNLMRQAESFKSAGFYHISVGSLRKRNEQLRHIQELFGDDRAYLIDSSKWTKNVQRLNDAVEWLGYHESCRFEELLEFNTAGGHGFQNAKETLSHRNANCKAIE